MSKLQDFQSELINLCNKYRKLAKDYDINPNHSKDVFSNFRELINSPIFTEIYDHLCQQRLKNKNHIKFKELAKRAKSLVFGMKVDLDKPLCNEDD